jgi:hypothetical protein
MPNMLPTIPADDPEPAALVWPPTMTPERAAYVQGALLGIFSAVIDSMLGDLAEASTDTPSLADRTMLTLIRKYLPRIRGMFLTRLAETDPAVLERLMGALATTTEQILAEAPGEPLDRWRFVWRDGEPLPAMIPDTWRATDG